MMEGFIIRGLDTRLRRYDYGGGLEQREKMAVFFNRALFINSGDNTTHYYNTGNTG